MLLKKLDLQGYKTFASNTEFVFEAGITAIVGPNGSGKSNIADAIRWVLGEQSYSLLRGKKTEDMIFAGSQRRARAGMAQVTLVLDNDDGQLPVAFSEVAITRRAYRSGENEYLINGSRVRLRDINELLAASGLGQRTYNVIGQGLVDAALSLRAEERRALFEEAAGIALYKERRQDALGRLETTRRNLERAADILGEIEPRMQRLERQAVRTREYDQVQTDLENLLYLSYGYHWEAAKRALRQARQEAARQSETLAAARQEQTALDQQLADLWRESNGLRQQLGDWHRQNSQLHRQAENLQRDLAVHTERARLLGQQQQELEAELEPLERQRQAAVDRLAQAEQALAEADSRRLTLQAAIQQGRTTLRQQQQLLAQIRDQERRAQQEWARLESRAATLEDSRRQLDEQQVRLTADRESIGEALAKQVRDHAAAEARLTDTQQRLEELSATLDDLANQRSALRAEREAGRVALEERRADHQAAATMLAELEARLAALADLRNRGAGHSESVQTLLSHPDRPAGILGPVGQLLQAPPELEIAIASALGDQTSALVVEDWAAVQAVMAWSERTGHRGRLSLLPLDRLGPPPVLTRPDNPTVIGVAAGLVSHDARYQPVIDLLLGQVVVTRDASAARELASSLAPGSLVATLDGLLMWQDGRVVHPGREDAQALGNLLAQERIWHALPDQLAQTRRSWQAAGSARAETESWLSGLDAQLSQIEAQTDRWREREQALNHEREAAALQVDRLAQNATWHRERLREAEQQAVALERERASLGEQVQELGKERTALLDRLERIRGLLAQLPLEEVQANLANQERALAQMEGGYQNQQALADTHRSARRQIESQIEARSQRIAAIEQERSQLAGRIEREQGSVQGLAQQISQVSQQIAPADTRLAEVEASHAGLLATEDRLRRRVRTAEQMYGQAHLALERRQDELEFLRSRIGEDLGLVNLPLDEDIAGQTPLPLGEVIGQLPVVKELPADIDETIQRRKQHLRRIGPINPNAPAEHAELERRHRFLVEQMADLNQADTKLRQVIVELDGVMAREFRATFDAVAAEFKQAFVRLFDGGSARLILTDPEDPIQSGVEIIARPPGRRQQGLALLSGGERSLTAAALVFALLKVSPTPFCVLDEMDAMLDEANVGRFREMLTELSAGTQFILITHNRGTIQSADTIYGISLGLDGTSQTISLRLEGDRLATAEGDAVELHE